MTHTALAIDPGVTTGMCFARIEDDMLMLKVDQDRVSQAGLFALLAQAIQDEDMALNSIIYEDFTYRNASRMGLDLTPAKMIGVIELFREWHEPLIGFYKQSASTGKGFYNNDKLKAIGAYVPGMEHGRDATRHMLQWITFGAGAQYIDIEHLTVRLLA